MYNDFANPRDYYTDEEWEELCRTFANPGGNSALRRETASNPRNLPCPTCLEPDRLTPADAKLGYQCDTCADAQEGYGGY
tara:strand:+ start:157 stop:396 length:240 start_codon:yes stop_codon:yes gene_type:complete